jgi:UDP-glucose 6-dehydrogenase
VTNAFLVTQITFIINEVADLAEKVSRRFRDLGLIIGDERASDA